MEIIILIGFCAVGFSCGRWARIIRKEEMKNGRFN